MLEEILIEGEVLDDLLGAQSPDFPTYLAGIINLVNGWSQATRPKNIGQLTELFPEFRRQQPHGGVNDWERWYEERYPEIIEEACQKTWTLMQKVFEAIPMISESMVRRWVRDLIVNKTYQGLSIQDSVLQALGRSLGLKVRGAKPEEERYGVDGFVGGVPVSVKPADYDAAIGRRSAVFGVLVRYEFENGTLRVLYDGDTFEDLRKKFA
jgi:hypothetical protein